MKPSFYSKIEKTQRTENNELEPNAQHFMAEQNGEKIHSLFVRRVFGVHKQLAQSISYHTQCQYEIRSADLWWAAVRSLSPAALDHCL